MVENKGRKQENSIKADEEGYIWMRFSPHGVISSYTIYIKCIYTAISTT